MFTQAEYELLRQRSPAELEQFLAALSLTAPASWDDFAQVQQLDDDVTQRIAQKLHSKSLLDGCYTLLEGAGISYAFSETTRALLERIEEHQADIRIGMTKARLASTEGEAHHLYEPAAPAHQTQNASLRYIGAGLLAADAVYLLAAAKCSPAVVVLLACVGGYMVVKGGKSGSDLGKSSPPPSMEQSTSKAKTVPAKFTETEAGAVLHILGLLRKLYQSL